MRGLAKGRLAETGSNDEILFITELFQVARSTALDALEVCGVPLAAEHRR
jgi:hypothetical protein